MRDTKREIQAYEQADDTLHPKAPRELSGLKMADVAPAAPAQARMRPAQESPVYWPRAVPRHRLSRKNCTPRQIYTVVMPLNPDVARLAEACAARLQEVVVADAATLEPDFRALLDAVRQTNRAFDFDRDGRPAAIAAVREALPLVERELLDAIIEDHACEIAAVHEAMFQVARAAGRKREE
jgi:hypothetical protein